MSTSLALSSESKAQYKFIFYSKPSITTYVLSFLYGIYRQNVLNVFFNNARRYTLQKHQYLNTYHTKTHDIQQAKLSGLIKVPIIFFDYTRDSDFSVKSASAFGSGEVISQ